jgi:hypothetical protein
MPAIIFGPAIFPFALALIRGGIIGPVFRDKLTGTAMKYKAICSASRYPPWRRNASSGPVPCHPIWWLKGYEHFSRIYPTLNHRSRSFSVKIQTSQAGIKFSISSCRNNERRVFSKRL